MRRTILLVLVAVVALLVASATTASATWPCDNCELSHSEDSI